MKTLKLEPLNHALTLEHRPGFSWCNVRIKSRANAERQEREIDLHVNAKQAAAVSRFFAELSQKLARRKR